MGEIVCDYVSGGCDTSYVQTKRPANIDKQLLDYKIPEEVRKRASYIHSKLIPGLKKKKKKIQLLWYCTYVAYNDLGMTIDPRVLGRRFGLEDSDCSKALNIFSPMNTGYDPEIRDISVPDLLKSYWEKLGLGEEILDQITEIYENYVSTSQRFHDVDPTMIVGALLWYVTEINGIDMRQRIFSVVSHTGASIRKHYEEISRLHNIL